MSNTTNINFNGDNLAIESSLSVSRFLQLQSIQDGRFLIVINDEVVPKSLYDTTLLATGDAIDILSPITGG